VNDSHIRIMLVTLSVVLLAIGMVQLIVIDSAVGGLGSITVALCLIVVASSTRKKQNNG